MMSRRDPCYNLPLRRLRVRAPRRGTMSDPIAQEFEEAARGLLLCAAPPFVQAIREIGDAIVASLRAGGKLMLCGNGGSAADAQHLAAELLVRLRPDRDRPGLPALALALDSSSMTACANDYTYDGYYRRMVETLGRPGDVLIGLSTSGESESVVQALASCAALGIVPVGFLGRGGGRALEHCQLALRAPADRTAIVQQIHMAAGHALLAYVEDALTAGGHFHEPAVADG